MRNLVIGLLLTAMLAAACGSDDPAVADDPGASTGMGPGISVSQALDSDLPGPLLVNGYLFVDAAGEVTLAEAILESYPPQPGGATIEVIGLDVSTIDLETAQGISWTETQIQVAGSVDDGKLRVDAGVSG